MCGVALLGAAAAACSPLSFVDDTIESGTDSAGATTSAQAGGTDTGSGTGVADTDDDDDLEGTTGSDEVGETGDGEGTSTTTTRGTDTPDTEGFTGDCCAPQPTPGCDDPRVAECVCFYDPFCCEREWDDLCVDIMQDAGCNDCTPESSGDGTSVGTGAGTSGQSVDGDCCSATDDAGCDDPDVEDCVCEVDPFCCDVLWDDTCAELAPELGCGCGAGGESTSTTGVGSGDTGGVFECCVATAEPGCPDDPEIEACVCALDPFCCSMAWDNLCVGQVVEFECGLCDYPVGMGPCCMPHPTPGCDEPDVQACVCEIDAFCCTVEWDGLCVDEVTGRGCGGCGIETTGSDTGFGGFTTGGVDPT